MRRVAGLIVLLGAIAFASATQAASLPWMTLPATPQLPKASTSGYAPVNGIRIWYAEFGHGAPVILLHGGLANSNYWGNQVAALETH